MTVNLRTAPVSGARWRAPVRLAFAAAIVGATGCAALTGARPAGGAGAARSLTVRAFRSAVDSLVLAPQFRNANWGVLIVDPTAGDTLYSRNAGKLFMPASNQKLLTGAVALAQLGTDYRFTTRFAANGVVRDGTIEGDLVVLGGGDPTFSDSLWGGDHRNAFRAIADSLAAHGVRRITGSLVRGPSPFTDGPCGYGWEADDLDEPFGACVEDLVVNEGMRRVLRLRTAGDTATNAVAIRNPQRAFLAALADALVERAIVVSGGMDSARVVADSGLVPVFTMQSPPLPVVVARMMKPSQNQVAELLFKTIGRERGGAGRADSARRVVERQLVAWGADTAGFAVRDGSGVSRHDYLTPETIIRVLDAMQRGPAAGAWRESLPIAGVDGTLSARMRGTAAEGNVRAKTGTVDKARSLSGYVTTADGRTLMFSFLCNNFTVPNREVERVQDTILSMLAARPRPRR